MRTLYVFLQLLKMNPEIALSQGLRLGGRVVDLGLAGPCGEVVLSDLVERSLVGMGVLRRDGRLDVGIGLIIGIEQSLVGVAVVALGSCIDLLLQLIGKVGFSNLALGSQSAQSVHSLLDSLESGLVGLVANSGIQSLHRSLIRSDVRSDLLQRVVGLGSAIDQIADSSANGGIHRLSGGTSRQSIGQAGHVSLFMGMRLLGLKGKAVVHFSLGSLESEVGNDLRELRRQGSGAIDVDILRFKFCF